MNALNRGTLRLRKELLLFLCVLMQAVPAGSACPKSCACYVPTEVHCTFRYLAAIPGEIQPTVERMNLGYNSLTVLKELDFSGLRHLELLMLHSNTIHTIEDKAFDDLQSLQVLKMSYNRVKMINKDTLQGLTSLIRLHMDHNRIEFINPEAFYGLTALQLVQLEGNLLQQLHPDTFITLRYSQIFKVSSVKNIYLSDNALSSLPANIFSHCTQLENLYLHGNPWSCDCRMEWFVDWVEQNAGILKCKRDRKYARGQLCPVCESPAASRGKTLAQVARAALSCAKPWIYPHLKKKNITVDEGDYSPVSSRDFIAPIGSLVMNMTDHFHNDASVVCTVQRPSGMDNLTVVHNDDTMSLSVSVATSLICNIDYEHIQKLWRILATYSDSPMHLERGLLLAKTPEMIYRYQQRRPGQNEDEVFTGIEAEMKANPAWLMQGEVTLQLDRTTTTFSTLHVRYTSTVQLRMENKAQRKDRYSWAMIKRDNLTKTEHSVLTSGVVDLNCQTWGDPKPSIDWILPDGSKVRAPYNSEDRRIVIAASGKLTLRAADTSDSGLYRCIGTNYLDADVLTFRITVLSPDVEEDDVNGVQLSKSLGDSLFLDCESSGNPKASIQWVLPDHTVLERSYGNRRIYQNGTLGVQELTERDRGFYRCLAGNYLGVDIVASLITISGTKFNSNVLLEGEGSGSEHESNSEESESSYNELPSSGPSQKTSQESRTITSDRPYPRHRFSHSRTSSDFTQRRRGPSTGRRNWGTRRVFGNTSNRVDPQKWAEIMKRAQKGKTAEDEEKTDTGKENTFKKPSGTSGDEDGGSGYSFIEEHAIDIYALERSTNRPLNLPVTEKLKVTESASEMLRISDDALEMVTDITPLPGPRTKPVVHTSTDPDSLTTFTAVTTTGHEPDEITFHTTQRITSPRIPAGSTIISHQQIHIIPPNKQRVGRRRNFPNRRRVLKPSRINDIHAYLNKLKKPSIKHKGTTTIPITVEPTTGCDCDDSDVEKNENSTSSETKHSLVYNTGSKPKPNIHSSFLHRTEKPSTVALEKPLLSFTTLPPVTKTYFRKVKSTTQPPTTRSHFRSEEFTRFMTSADAPVLETTQDPRELERKTAPTDKQSTTIKPTTRSSKVIRGRIPWEKLFGTNQSQKDLLSRLRKPVKLTTTTEATTRVETTPTAAPARTTTLLPTTRYLFPLTTSQGVSLRKSSSTVPLPGVGHRQSVGHVPTTAPSFTLRFSTTTEISPFAETLESPPTVRTATTEKSSEGSASGSGESDAGPHLDQLEVTDRTTQTTKSDTLTISTAEPGYTTSTIPNSSNMDSAQSNKYDHLNGHQTTSNVIGLEPSLRDLQSKPRIIGGNAASFTVLSNSDAFLPCEAVGNPEPAISWKRFSSGSTLTIRGRMGKFEMFKNGTLLIQNANIKDRGQYLCQAENNYGSDKLLVTLSVVSYPSRILEPKLREMKSHTGDTVEIKCRTDGRPLPVVSWILANRTQVRGYNTDRGRVSVTPDGTLVIQQVTVFDRGHYKCIASNPAGADTATVRLQVVAAPPGILEEKRQQVKVESGQSLMLPCTAQGSPQPTVHWVLFDGTAVRPLNGHGHKASVFTNGTLLLRGLAVSDSGKYECIVTSSTGSERRVVSLTVEQTETMPKIVEVTQRSTELNYGGRLWLNCSAVGEPMPRILWRLPSKALVDQWHRMGSRIQVLENGTLIIDSVSDKDAGDYLCIARSKIGDDLQLMKVSVSMKPAKIMTKPLGKKQVPFGNDLKVDCKASGTPEPEISWGLPDGTVLNSAMQADDSRGRTRRYVLFDNGTLYFNKIGMTEEGDYTCYAENTLGKDEMHVHISVLTAAPRIRPSRTYAKLKPGGNMRFDCEAVGEPKPKILWMLPSHDMIAASNDRYLMHVNGSLDIRDIKLVDAGEYVCTARNAAGDDRKVYNLAIDGNLPIINGHRQNRTVVKDSASKHSRKLIDCKAEGSPPPRITWIMPDNIFLSAPYYGSRINVHPNGTLEIRNVRPSDTAEFICMARNDGGEAVMVVQLEVTSMLRRPIFKNPFNERVVARLGKTVVLNCSADGNPNPEISWLLPNGTRFTNDARTSRYYLGSDGNLVIYNPTKEDTGKYRCSAKNKMGYIEKLVVLEVGQRPYIVTRPRGIIRGVSGDSLFLHCLTDGSPRPNIHWTVPGGQVLSRPQVSGRYHLLENGTLVVRETTLHDRGNYLCRAKNDMGEAVLSVPVAIIAYPPRITNGPPTNVRAVVGVSVQLNCMAIGIPKPEISWELPDRSVLSTANKGRNTGTELLHPQGTLVIQKPTSSDSGTYKCMAKNHMGTDTRATYVHVL
ncbi:immunoglobulin superfamily member 10 [Conger conger]|uniref:immunoglobulin superfamily member 10 n=1 Tax=Conger conger TaxID=82655 RepID=UPI002A5A29CB|nr:immunoglobulin superfamily member 10 [Conger conger]